MKLNIPLVKQETQFTCGPASLRSVFLFNGNDVPESEITELVTIDPELGTSLKEMVKIIKYYGYYGEAYVNGTMEMIEEYLSQNIPVIVNWFSIDKGHYSVISGIENYDIYFMDPEFGTERSMPIKQFESLWFGLDDILDPGAKGREMIIIHPIE